MPWESFVIAIVGIVVGGMIFLVPGAAFALRWGLQPLIKTWAEAKQAASDHESARARDVALDERIERIETVLGRLVEDTEFLKELRDPESEE